MMLTIALLGAALAQSPISALDERMGQPAPPAWAFSCAPLSDIADILRVLPIDDGRPEAVRTTGQRALIPLLKPGALEPTGIDPSGAMVVSGSGAKDQEWMLEYLSLPFTGDGQQASILVEALSLGAIPGDEPDIWRLTAGEGMTLKRTKTALVARHDSGSARVFKAQQALLSGLPSTPGCAGFALVEGMDTDTQIKMRALKVRGMSMFIPTRGGTSHVRVLTGIELDVDLDGAEIGTPLGSSHQQPDVTMLWAMDPLDLLAEIARFLPPTRNASELRKALQNKERPIKIPPGAVTVVFSEGPRKDFAAIIPVHSRRGNRVWAGTLAKGVGSLLEGMKIPVKKTSRTRLTVGTGDKELYIGTQWGLVFVATRIELLEEMLDGEGRPWVTEGLEAMASGAAIAAEVRIPPTPDAPAANLRAGLGLSEGLWDLQLQVEMPEVKSQRVVDMLQAAMRLNPALQTTMVEALQGPSAQTSLKKNLQGIAVAERAYHAEHDSFLAVNPWPRTVESLSQEAVRWRTKDGGSEGFDTIGWAPEGDLRSTYWVELSEDGSSFTVFGAIDEDGDGEAAVFKALFRPQEPKIETVRVTAADVY